MTFSLRIIFLITLIVNTSLLTGQQTVGITDEVYGSDPLLFNGKYYTYYAPFNTTGTQYFTDRKFTNGSVTLRGITYTDRQINYDIYNQQLVLRNETGTGAVNLIVVSNAWLESFSFSGLDFVVFTDQDTLKNIYQVLGKGEKSICYRWYRDLNLDTFYGSRNMVFSSPKKEMNLFDGQHLTKYTNKRTFCALFEESKRNVIKDYLRKNHITLKKATDQSVIELVLFCNSLYTK